MSKKDKKCIECPIECPYVKDLVFLEKLVNAKFESADKSLALAAGALDKRLDGMNEFRAALKDQSDKNLTRTEYEVTHQRIIEDIRSLRESRSEIQGKASQEDVEKAKGISGRAFTVSVISVVIVLLGLIANVAFNLIK